HAIDRDHGPVGIHHAPGELNRAHGVINQRGQMEEALADDQNADRPDEDLEPAVVSHATLRTSHASGPRPPISRTEKTTIATGKPRQITSCAMTSQSVW